MSSLIPRLSMAELDPQLQEALRPKVDRLKYLGEFFQCTGHQPQALTSFHKLTEDLKQALPASLTEVVALSVATITDNSYERVQHERLSVKLGFSEAWIREVISRQAGSAGQMSETEHLVQKFVAAVIERQGKDTTQEFEAVIKAIGHKDAIGVLLLIGRYVMHAFIANSLALAPPVTSPFDEKN
jgi:alkylhydroperoxidase family enzyme